MKGLSHQIEIRGLSQNRKRHGMFGRRVGAPDQSNAGIPIHNSFDTDFLIYSCDYSDPRRQQRAFELLAVTEDGVLLWQVAAEFLAASRKLASQALRPHTPGRGYANSWTFFNWWRP